MKHLSEDQIQEYLDGGVQRHSVEVDHHLAECAECQQLIETYRLLYRDLSTVPEIELSPQFASNVVSRIQTARSQKKNPFWVWAAASVGAVVAIIGTLVIAAPSSMSSITHNFNAIQIRTSDSVLSWLGQFTPLSAENFHLALFAGALLLLFGLMDRSLLRSRNHRRATR